MKNFAKSFITPYRNQIQALPIGLCREMTGDPRAITVDADWFSAALDLGVRGRGSVKNVAAASRTIRSSASSGGAAVFVMPVGEFVEWQTDVLTNGYYYVTYSSGLTVYTGYFLAASLNIQQQPKAELLNAGVSFDFTTGPGQALNQIVGVYIDNSDVPTPVYLRCDDTGQIVSCSDYKSGHFTLLTTNQKFTLFTENVIPAYASQAKTRLIFYNTPVPNFAEEQFNEVLPLNRVSGLAQYRSKAIGDKILTVQVDRNENSPGVGNIVLYSSVAKPAKANCYLVFTDFSVTAPLCLMETGGTQGYQYPLFIKVKIGSDVVFAASYLAGDGTKVSGGVANTIIYQPVIDRKSDANIMVLGDQDLIFEVSANAPPSSGYRLSMIMQIGYTELLVPVLT